MRHRSIPWMIFVATLLLALSPAAAQTVKLQPETIKAWDDHVRVVERAIDKALAEDKSYLWIDENPRNRLRVRQGEILTHQFKDVDVEVPGGMIHDWIGVMFIPGRNPRTRRTLTRTQNRIRRRDRRTDVRK